jgi:type II secretory pathway predicted ATPase ExeA
MFLSFYQMREEPFGVSPDPRFLYLGESHREALSSLLYGIQADRGFMMLVAQPGSGKTTLIFKLIEQLKPDARTVLLFQTQCNSRELMQYLLNELGVDIDGMETVAMHRKLNQILTQERLAGRRFILIVDEAQNLDSGVLETIRLLSNLETSHSKLLQILLVGQPQLARTLASPSLEQLQQRISLFARLDPFGPDDIALYIAHRLQVAGYRGGDIFTAGALEILRQGSQGIPRNINRLCFSALSLGHAMGRRRIDSDMMREVVADHAFESSEGTHARQPVTQVPQTGRTTLKTNAPVIIHPAAGDRLSKWGAAITGVAATIAIAAGIFAYSHGRMSRSLPAGSHASVPPRHASTLAIPAVQAQTTSLPSSPSEKTEDVPAVTEVPPPTPTALEASSHEGAASATESEPTAVRVRPGETLQQIALRTLGQDDSKLIKLIQQLNPRIKDPNHIEINQEILLPQVSNATDPQTAATADESARKN